MSCSVVVACGHTYAQIDVSPYVCTYVRMYVPYSMVACVYVYIHVYLSLAKSRCVLTIGRLRWLSVGSSELLTVITAQYNQRNNNDNFVHFASYVLYVRIYTCLPFKIPNHRLFYM